MAKLSHLQKEIIYQMKNHFDNDDANSICIADLSDVMLYEENDLQEEVDKLVELGVLDFNHDPASNKSFYIV